jgi:flagellar biosynthesis protein FliR
MTAVVLALRGAAAIGVLTTLVGGLPRLVQLGLAALVGAWSAVVVGAASPAVPMDALWPIAARELVIGATIGLVAALPLIAAAAAGRLVDLAAGAHSGGPYGALFGVLAAAVFVGVDGHVAVIEAIATSFRDAPAVVAMAPGALATLAALVPAAVQLAMPWLITAAVIDLAVGVAVRVAGRVASAVPLAAAAPAALVMMTASLLGTLAVAIARVVR